MKKIQSLCLLLISLFGLQSAIAQYDQVLRASTFGGVSTVGFNPAIAGNHYKFDMNLISFGLNADNNYIGMSMKPVYDSSLWYVDHFQDEFTIERLNGRQKSVFVGYEQQLPLSFMFSWGKAHSNKNAIALTNDVKLIANVDNVSEMLARSSYWGLDYKADSITGFNFDELHEKNIAIKTAAWMSTGLTYSRELMNKNDKYLKAGATLQFNLPLMGAYAYTQSIDYRFDNFDSLNMQVADVYFGHDESILNYTTGNADTIIKNYILGVNPGLSVGVVFEWRPDQDKYRYDFDCVRYLRQERDKYKLAIGASITDIGMLRYQKSPYTYNVNANIQDWYVKGDGIADIATFDSAVNNRLAAIEDKGKFTLWLPTRFNLFADYHVSRLFSVNLTGSLSPNLMPRRNQIHYPSYITLTPKIDHKYYGVYLPISYNSFGELDLGFGLRGGPLFVSSSNIISPFIKGKATAFNIQFGLKVSVPNRKQPADRDGDLICNHKDECKKLKGSCASGGCPDQDNDGVIDEKDQCPEVAGPIDLKGCPDSDGDKIVDVDDDCPKVFGVKKLKGCPDKDDDGITDAADDCPEEKGLKENGGCPDKDGDKVIDRKDKCPDLAGDPAHGGCPDSDKDGVFDDEDGCIKVVGPVENLGCPWPDSDGDGVLDKDDDCPKVKGLATNKGCPQLEKKELETIKYAFDNLEFETGKDVIRSSSFPALNSLAKLLVDKPAYGLGLDGHTDNVGEEEANRVLSLKRAEAVKAYLVKKGVDASRMQANGFGETKPVADNTTATGRQKNRRVEMRILFLEQK